MHTYTCLCDDVCTHTRTHMCANMFCTSRFSNFCSDNNFRDRHPPRKLTYIHTRMHAYIHTYIHTHMYIHACIHTYVHTHTHVHTCTHMCTHTYIHAYIHTYMHTYIHTYIYKHTYMHKYRSYIRTDHLDHAHINTYISHAIWDGALCYEV